MSRCYGEAVELFWCVVRQFNVRSVVHQEEFQLMRASFYFTHHIDTGALHPLLLCRCDLDSSRHAVAWCVLHASCLADYMRWATVGQPAQV